jgi:4,5-DOPA dioxygenase extradiol
VPDVFDESTEPRLPALFVSHGSPLAGIERREWNRTLAEFASTISRPRALVVVSGHWEAPRPVRVASSAAPKTIHDFSGCPEELYRIRYPAPGDPALAAHVRELLAKAGFEAQLDPERGLDHGAWIPARSLFPDASVPIVELAQPLPRTPADGLRIGAAISRLREEGVLLIGSGGIVHNLARMDFADDPSRVAPWARAFDSWIAQRLETMDVAAIASYRFSAPDAERAVPTPEHFDPIFVVLGSARPGERVRTIHEGFRYGTISMRTFAIG